MDNKKNVIDLANSEDINILRASIDGPTSIRFKHKGDIATGVAVPSGHPAAIEYLSNYADYNDTSADIKKQIKLCRKMYVWEGIVGTIIDMICDLSTSNVKVDNIKSNKGKEIIDYFLKELNKGNNNITTGIVSLSYMCAYCFFIDGNIFLYNKWHKVKYGKRASQTAKIPNIIVPIDPTLVDIPVDTIQFGRKQINLRLASDVFGLHSRTTKNMQNDLSVPLRVRKAIKSGEKYVTLSDDEIYHIKRRGTTFGAWGVPYLTRAFSAVASKGRLRALDDNTTDGMINSITIFKVGDPNVPATLNPSRIDRLQSLLANPTGAMTLAWSYDIDVIHVGPSGDVLDFSDKYEQVNYDILTALGMPLSVITGEGNKAGDVWVAVAMVMERLESFRHEMREYLRHIVTRILEENGIYYENPVVRTPSPKLRREDIKQFILNLFDRGLLSRKTSIEETGFDFDAEREQKKSENQEGLEEIFNRPHLPYDSKDETNPPADRKNVDEKEKQIETTPAFVSFVREELLGARKQFATLSGRHGIIYASLWFYNRLIELQNVLHPYGYNIKAASRLIKDAIAANDKVNIINKIYAAEVACLSAAKEYAEEEL